MSWPGSHAAAGAAKRSESLLQQVVALRHIQVTDLQVLRVLTLAKTPSVCSMAVITRIAQRAGSSGALRGLAPGANANGVPFAGQPPPRPADANTLLADAHGQRRLRGRGGRWRVSARARGRRAARGVGGAGCSRGRRC